MAVAKKIMDKPVKHPQAVLDYDLDLTNWLLVGETIVSATVTVLPAGLTVGSPLITSPKVKVWVSGGTAAIDYTLTFKCVTSSTPAREYVAQMEIPVKV